MNPSIRFQISTILQPEYAPWRDLAGTLYFAVENILEQEKVMIKLKNIEEEREKGKFNFSVFVIKRPDLYPNWTDPFYADWSEPDSDNDYEDGPEEQIFYCTLVSSEGALYVIMPYDYPLAHFLRTHRSNDMKRRMT